MNHSNSLVVRARVQRSIVGHVLSRAVLAALIALPATSFADARSGGASTTTNVTLDNAVDEATDIWDVLQSKSIALLSTSNIIVTACSDVDNPAGSTANTYNFVIALDDTSPGLNTGSERSVDDLYDDPNKNDADMVSVCTTRSFTNVGAGAHTIYWLGSKASTTMTNTTILDSSMTVGAFDGIAL
jgi:hypothetical protein